MDIDATTEVIQGDDVNIDSDDPDGSIVSTIWTITPTEELMSSATKQPTTLMNKVWFDRVGEYEINLVVEDDLEKTSTILIKLRLIRLSQQRNGLGQGSKNKTEPST